MAKICNFPISNNKRCTQPISNSKPNCGRHKTDLSAQQLGRNPTAYEKDGELHVWAGVPDGLYCLIHDDPEYQMIYQLVEETAPYCLKESIEWQDKQGRTHRDDGPAVINPDGTQIWFQHGECHRDGGPAAIRPRGTQFWYQHGELHRDDGPAVIDPSGTQMWFQHNEVHREDGPAIVMGDGTQHWMWHGQGVTKKEHAKLRKQSKSV
jgi:hypothetical protein